MSEEGHHSPSNFRHAGDLILTEQLRIHRKETEGFGLGQRRLKGGGLGQVS